MYYIQLLCSNSSCMGIFSQRLVLICISVGLSVARFDNPGNAKALIAWNEWQIGSALFRLYISLINSLVIFGA